MCDCQTTGCFQTKDEKFYCQASSETAEIVARSLKTCIGKSETPENDKLSNSVFN